MNDLTKAGRRPIEQYEVDAQTGRSMTTARPNVLQRAIQWGLRYALDVRTRDAWMSPGNSIQPVAQEEEGRTFDFPVGVNANTRPRSNEGLDFAMLRSMADGYDLIRLVIERRKDQMEKLRWKFITTDSDEDNDEEDERVKQLKAFFAYPDRINAWGTWLRMVVEEVLVIDALTLYPRRTNGGDMYSLDVMDGATIKVLIDHQGRRPMLPHPAFQQYIKGAAAIDYNADEIIYAPRNPRANKFYGYSNVEQVVMTVNIALRRQTHQLNYYTEGNIPEAFIPTPETWTPKQVKQFQRDWDVMMENAKQKRKAKFIPNVKNVIFTREPTLKDDMDEWLGRVICFAFSYPPSALTAQVNRATAETAQETGEDEGLGPLMQYVAGIINMVVRKYFGYDDIQFAWETDKALDPKVMAEIHDTRIENDTLTVDEARKEMGKQPFNIKGQTDVPKSMREQTPAQKAEADALQAKMTGEPGDPAKPGEKAPKAKGQDESNEGDDDITTKLAKGMKAVTESMLKNQRRSVVRKAEKAMAAALGASFTVMADKIADAYAEHFGKMAKAAPSIEDVNGFIDNLLIELDSSARVVKEAIETVTQDGAGQAMLALKMTDAPALSLANSRASDYAISRSVELITKGADGGKLSETTREMLRAMISEAAENGATNEAVAKQLRESYAFSQRRAMTIAKTELRAADVQGNLAGYRASGVVKRKEWLLSNENRICEECTKNAEQGPIALDDFFQSGDEGAPAHPNCRCDIAPVID